MKCNKCWIPFEPKTKSVASSCGHLFCLTCAEDLLGSSEGGSCPLCEALITKSSVKIVNVLQDPRACQEPETALSSALASIKFYIQQKELDANLLQNKLSTKVDRVQEACKRKLQEVHSGYLTAKRKYQEILEAKNVLEVDNEELKLKYQSKAQQTRKHVELSKKLQETCERLQRENTRLQQENDALRGGGQLMRTPTRGMQPNMVFPRQPSPRPEQVMTTVHHKQVYVGPGQQARSGATGFGSGAAQPYNNLL